MREGLQFFKLLLHKFKIIATLAIGNSFLAAVVVVAVVIVLVTKR